MRGVDSILVLDGISSAIGHFAEMQRQVQAIERVRRGNRSVNAFMKMTQHRAASAAGGGSREVARRARQIAAGQLQVSR